MTAIAHSRRHRQTKSFDTPKVLATSSRVRNSDRDFVGCVSMGLLLLLLLGLVPRLQFLAGDRLALSDLAVGHPRPDAGQGVGRSHQIQGGALSFGSDLRHGGGLVVVVPALSRGMQPATPAAPRGGRGSLAPMFSNVAHCSLLLVGSVAHGNAGPASSQEHGSLTRNDVRGRAWALLKNGLVAGDYQDALTHSVRILGLG